MRPAGAGGGVSPLKIKDLETKPQGFGGLFTLGSSSRGWNLLDLPQLRHACPAGFYLGRLLTARPIHRLEVL